MFKRLMASLWKYTKYVFEFMHSPYTVLRKELDDQSSPEDQKRKDA